MLGTLIRRPRTELRDLYGGMSWADYLRLWETFGFGGVTYQVPSGSLAQISALQGIRNPVVLTCIVIRAMTFSEITFAFRRGRALVYDNRLGPLEQPWPGGSTGEMLARVEVDVSMYGNSYWWMKPGYGLVWQDPVSMKILTADIEGPSGKPAGQRLLAYQTQDKNGQPCETFLPSEIIHHRPIPDPNQPFRGLSWLSGLLPDVSADQLMTEFKQGFLRNSAVPSLVVSFNQPVSKDAFTAFKDKLEAAHAGSNNAFKTLYLGSGADVKTVGVNWGDMQLAMTQSLGETRLALAAGVPATIVGIAEGLKGSSLNAGNYTATRRRFADITMRPLWRSACAALAPAVQMPRGTKLWYDDRDVLFLQADLQDAANQRQSDSVTMMNLVNAGFEPQTVVTAVQSGDWSALQHTGLASVQLQPIGVPVDVNNGMEPADVGAGENDGEVPAG